MASIAARQGDVNGDGVVDGDDLMEVVTGIGSNGTPGYEDGSGLTEVEADAIEAALAQAMGIYIESDCALCTYRPCWCFLTAEPPPTMVPDQPDPDTEPGDDGVTLPPGGGPPGSGGPGPNHPDGDENLDGILNKHDCLSAHYGGSGAACDTNSNGIPDTGDCGSCLFVGDISQCDCGDVDIAFTPGCSERTPNYVWMIPEGQLPKVVTIRACAGPPGGYYQWLPLHSEVAEYEPGQDLTGSSVRVRLKKGGNFWATCTYVAEIDGDLCQVHFEQFAGAVVHSVKLESVEFSGGHTVLRDDGTAYPSPAWKDGNLDGDADDAEDHKFPIAFTRNTPWRVAEAIVRIEPPNVVVGPVTLTMTSPGKPTIEAESHQIAGGLRFSSAPSEDPLPNTVDYHSSLPIAWKLDFGCDGKPNTKSFTTRHPYYVTLGNPQVQLHHTILHIGCKNAKGMATADAVVAGIWSEFATGVADGVMKADQPAVGPPSPSMRYWNPPVDDREDPISGATPLYREMLKRPAANGQCGAWANLFHACLRVHGIGDGSIHRVLGPQGQFGLMLVQDWQFPDTGLGSCNGYGFIYDTDLSTAALEHADVIDLVGVLGQGNPNPPGAFVNHFVFVRGGQVYDPSYGLFAASKSLYENMAMAGWVRECPVEGFGLVQFATPQDPATDELTFTVWGSQ